MNIKYIFFDCWDTLIEYHESNESLANVIMDHVKNPNKVNIETINDGLDKLNGNYFSKNKFFELPLEVLLKNEFDLLGIETDIDFSNPIEVEKFQDEILKRYYRPTPTKGILHFLDYAKTNGFHLAVLSNTIYSKRFTLNAIINTFKWSEEKFNSYFDLLMVSSEVAFKKPNDDFFRLGMKKVGCSNPSDAIYIGDSPTFDVLGSASAKMNPCHFNFKNNATSSLNQIKGLFSFKDYSELESMLKNNKEYRPRIPEEIEFGVHKDEW